MVLFTPMQQTPSFLIYKGLEMQSCCLIHPWLKPLLQTTMKLFCPVMPRQVDEAWTNDHIDDKGPGAAFCPLQTTGQHQCEPAMTNTAFLLEERGRGEAGCQHSRLSSALSGRLGPLRIQHFAEGWLGSRRVRDSALQPMVAPRHGTTH